MSDQSKGLLALAAAGYLGWKAMQILLGTAAIPVITGKPLPSDNELANQLTTAGLAMGAAAIWAFSYGYKKL